MNEHMHSNGQPGTAAMASSVLATLKDELDALVRLRGRFDDHVVALRKRDKEQLDEATNRTNDEVNALARLKNTRDRKLRLLGRVLHLDTDEVSVDEVVRRLDGEQETARTAVEIRRLREEIRSEALTAQSRCRDVEFALEHAVHLGRDLLQALKGEPSTASTRVYTPSGDAVESSGASSFLNRVG